MTAASRRALRLILEAGGLEEGQVHQGRQGANEIHATTAHRLVELGLARWEECPVRPTPRPTRRRHAQLRRWLDREKRGTIPTLHATAAGCRAHMKIEN